MKKPGPKPGSRHPGQFKAGYDPRRSGDAQKAAMRKEISELCKEHTDEAVALLVDTMRDDEAPLPRRIQCADMILAYGHGRPVSREQHLSVVAHTMLESGAPVREMSDTQLHAMLAEVAASRLPAPSDEPIVDGELVTEPDPSPE
jgi:hypothetical protein